MNIQLWVDSASRKFRSVDVPTPDLDTEILLSNFLNQDRSWLHAHPEFILQRSDLRKLNQMVARRMMHEPIAYILGKQEFYGREFIVTPDTLTPRPETETMIELLLNQVGGWRSEVEELQVVDVGTGSGCIIITAALEMSKVGGLMSKVTFIGLDISKSALKVAKKNSKVLKANVEFKHFDMMNDELSSILNLQTSICILANLPYVPNNFKINLAATHEPPFAIYGGTDGLDYYRRLFEQLSKFTVYGLQFTVLTESLPPQHKELEKIAKNSGFNQIQEQDFIQVFIKF